MKCQHCKKDLPQSQFPPSSSPFWTEGIVNICYSCTPKFVDRNNLNQVDRWCQWVNLAFFPNEWMKISQRESDPFKAYCATHKNINYYKYDWSEQNKQLMKIAADGLIEDEIDELRPSLIRRLKSEWGSDVPEEDLLMLERRYSASLNDHNVATDIQRDSLRKIARLSVMIDREMQAGKVDKDKVTLYDKLVTSTIKTLESMEGDGITSISELIDFIERNGYQANFYDGVPRDEIDLIINNVKEYVKDLIEGEVNLTEIYEQKKKQLEHKKNSAASIEKVVEDVYEEEDDE